MSGFIPFDTTNVEPSQTVFADTPCPVGGFIKIFTRKSPENEEIL